LIVSKATILGIAEEVSEPEIDKIISRSESSSKMATKPPRQKKNDALYQKLLSGKLDHLTLEDKQQIEPVFHDEDDTLF
jgi:hypothetical protein